MFTNLHCIVSDNPDYPDIMVGRRSVARCGRVCARDQGLGLGRTGHALSSPRCQAMARWESCRQRRRRTRRERPWRSRARPGRRQALRLRRQGRKTPACRRTKSSQETYKRTKPATYQTSLSHKRISLSDKWSNPAAYRTNLSHKRISKGRRDEDGGRGEEKPGWDEDGVSAGSQGPGQDYVEGRE